MRVSKGLCCRSHFIIKCKWNYQQFRAEAATVMNDPHYNFALLARIGVVSLCVKETLLSALIKSAVKFAEL